MSQAHLREVLVLAQVITQKFNCLPSRQPFRSLTSAVISLMLPLPQTHVQHPLWGLSSGQICLDKEILKTKRCRRLIKGPYSVLIDSVSLKAFQDYD